MTEHILPSAEYLDELRTPAERLEMLIDDFSAEGTRLKEINIKDAAKVESISNKHMESALDRLAAIAESGAIGLRLTGEGVMIPDTKFTQISDGSGNVGVGVLYPADKPSRVLLPDEVEVGYIEGVITSHTIKEDGTFAIRPKLVVRLLGVDRSPITLNNSYINFIELNVARRAFVEFEGLADSVKVLELEDIRQQNSTIEDLSRKGLANTMFARQLKKIQQNLYAIDEQDTDDYVLMNRLPMLLRIGELGALHARQSIEHAAVVENAVFETLGAGRMVKITFEQVVAEGISAEATIRGNLTGVKMPQFQDDTTPATLFVEYANFEGEKISVPVPFADIKAFAF